MKLKTLKNKRGFTIVEMLVAIFVFTILVAIVSGISISVVKNQRKIFAIQDTQEAGRFIMESVIKELRTSFVNNINEEDGTYFLQELNITNDKGQTVVYAFSNGRMYRQNEPISPSSININSNSGFLVQRFALPGRTMATIVLDLEHVGVDGKSETESHLNLQGSILSRVMR